jgi:hypothetical protein
LVIELKGTKRSDCTSKCGVVDGVVGVTDKSVDFEKQISRIYKVLAEKGHTVTWNEKIPDPDNLKQQRQIDILVTTKSGCIHIECRDRQSPQDVNWIEKLVGRKNSLGAASMIAVSSTGFTEGALLKAKRFGIFTRQLNELTADEVASWGNLEHVVFDFLKFLKFDITLKVTDYYKSSKSSNDYFKGLYRSGTFVNALTTIASKFDSKPFNQSISFSTNILFQDNDINMNSSDIYVSEMNIDAQCIKIQERQSVETIMTLTAPTIKNSASPNVAEVHSFSMPDWELILTDNNSSFQFDFSKVEVPENHFWGGCFMMDLGLVRKIHICEPRGLESLYRINLPIIRTKVLS